MSYEVGVRAVNAAGDGDWSGNERLVAPVGVTLTAGDTEPGFDIFKIVHLIDGSGLSAPATLNNFGTVTHSGADSTRWVTTSTESQNYFAAGRPSPRFELDLGRARELDALVVWGFGGNANEASAFTVEFSTDGGDTYSTDTESVQTSELLGAGSERLDFSRSRRADNVRLTVTANAASSGHGGDGVGDRVAMSELRLVADIEQGTPRGVPTKPDAPGLVAGNEKLVVSWGAPDSGGWPITSYDLRHRVAGSGESGWTEALSVWTSGVGGDLVRTIPGLVNGVSYEVGVRAVNAAGDGGWSDSAQATPERTPPEKPQPPSLTAGDEDGELVVSWAALGDGGWPITSYDLRHRVAGSGESGWTEALSVWTSGVGGDLKHTVGSLVNGVSYEVGVRAVNAAGDGGWSDSAQGTPKGVPAKPDAPGLVAGNEKLVVWWGAPDSGGWPITSYDLRHRVAGSGESGWTEALSVWTSGVGGDLVRTIPGLVNGVSYEVGVRAVNAAGDGGWSDSAQATPRGVPTKPSPPTLTPYNGRLAVAWTAPVNDGGAAVSSYDVSHSRDDGSSWIVVDPAWTSGPLSHTVSGLVNGVSHLVRVRAVSAAGEGGWSDSAQATPRGVPERPLAPSLAVGDEELVVSWVAPDSGGSAVTSYDVRYSRDDGNWMPAFSVISGVRTRTIRGLVNGVSYEVGVRAVNALGDGDWSDSAQATPAAVPAKPVAPTLVAYNEELEVSWAAPGDGGSEITSYDVRHRVAGSGDGWSEALSVWTSGVGGDLVRTIPGLVNGVSYEVGVRAVNAAGDGDWSDSAPATPWVVPERPSAPSLAVGDEELVVSWVAPDSGGSEITSYDVRYRRDGVNWMPAVSVAGARTYTIRGLVNGVSYEVGVRAVSAAGKGGWSDSAQATPRVVPERPSAPSLAVGDEELVVSWVAPDSGGLAITFYDLRHKLTSGGNDSWVEVLPVWTSTGGGDLEHTIPGLDNGESYDVRVRAVNAAGDGDWSDTETATPTDPSITISGGSAVTEGTAASFTVTASPVPTSDRMVNLSVSEAAGSDFVASGDEGSRTVTITSGSTSETFTVSTQGDIVDEPNGSVTVAVAAGTDYSVGTASSATVTVNDDDATPGITLSLAETVEQGGMTVVKDLTTMSEGDAAKTVTVTATVTGSRFAADKTLTVSVAGSGTTTAVDFAAVSNFDIMIAAGAASATGTFTLTPTVDVVDEDDETVTVSGALEGVTVTPATVSLTDDDDAPTGVTLSLSHTVEVGGVSTVQDLTTMGEGDAARTVTVTATVTGGTRFAADKTVTVSVAGSGVASAVDFTEVSDFNIVIAAGTETGTATFTLTPTDDIVDEDDETVTVSGALDGVTVTSDTVSLTDDDTASTTITLSADPSSIDENAAGDSMGDVAVSITATLSGTVTYAADTVVMLSSTLGGTAGSADYAHSGLPGSVTIPAESLSGTATGLKVDPTDNSVSAGDKTIVVNPQTLSGFTVRAATITLDDDEDPVIELRLGTTTAAESAASTSVVVTASRDTQLNADEVTVTLSLSGGAARDTGSGGDYTASGTLSVTIPADQADAVTTIGIDPRSDKVKEGSETVVFGGSASGFSVTSATFTITDVYTASTSIALRVDPASLAETVDPPDASDPPGTADPTKVTVRATVNDGAPTSAITVTLSLGGTASAGSGKDYTFTPSTLPTITIAANKVSGTATINIDPADDVIDEGTGETIVVSGSTTASGINTVTPATVDLTDDDDVPTGVTLSLSHTVEVGGVSTVQDLTTMGEGDAARTVTVTATVTGGTRFAADKTVTVSVAGSGVASAVDFTEVSDFNITIAAGAVNGSATFTLTPTNDIVDETDETVTVSGALTGVTVVSDSLTLTDDDDAPTGVTLSLSHTVEVGGVSTVQDLTTMGEGDAARTVTVTATVTGGTRFATDKTVTVSVAGSDTVTVVDFTEVSDFNIVIAAGAETGTATFTLTPTNDIVDETDETVTVSGALSGVTVVSDSLTLTDDDAAPTGVTLSLTDATDSSNIVDLTTVTENGGARTVTVTATVTSSTRFATDETVVVSVAGSNTATAVDFTAVSDFNITIAAGTASGSATFTLTPTNDSVDEDDETVTVSGALSGVTVVSDTLSLTDDDAAPTGVSLSVGPSTVTENGGAKTVTVTARPTGGTRFAAAQTVAVSVAGSGTATAVDFAAVSDFNVTIAAGAASGSASFVLTPENDIVDEDNETVTVSGTLSGVTVSDAT